MATEYWSLVRAYQPVQLETGVKMVHMVKLF